MLKIPGVYVDFKGDLTELKRDFKKVRELAKQSGTDISNGMKNAVMPNTVTRSMNRLYQDLTKINRVASVTAADMKKLGVTLDKDLLKNIQMTDREFKQLQRRMLNTKAEQQAERAIKSLGRQAKLTTIEMAMLRRKVGDTKGAFRGLATAVKSRLGSIAMSAAAATAAFVAMGYAVQRTSQMIWETGRATKVSENAFKEITGSVAAANKEFEFLRETADELGLNFYTLRDGYIGFLAAAKDSKLPMEEVRRVFRAVSNAAAILGLSNDRVKNTFMALEQMMSKGKVSMEELRRQMGDNLYGAFQLAAKAMGISTAELDKLVSSGKLFTEDFIPKFTRVLEQKFVGTIDDSVKATNKFDQTWTDLKNQMAESGFMDSATKALEAWTDTLKDPEVITAMKEMADLLGQMLVMSSKLGSVVTSLKKALSWGYDGKSGDDYWKQKEKEWASSIHGLGGDMSLIPTNQHPPTPPQTKYTTFDMFNTSSGADAVYAGHLAMQEMQREVERAVAAAMKSKSNFDPFAVDQRDQWVYNGIKAMEDLRIEVEAAVAPFENLKDVGEETADSLKGAFDGWANNFSQTLTDLIWESDFSFKSIARSYGKMLTEMLMQENVVKPSMGIFNQLFSSVDWSSLFNWSAKGNVFDNTGVMAYAQGGAFTNSIVDKPTLFASGGALGGMGEAGPEAILPLSRTSSGDLGVKATGKGGGGVTYIINIMANDAKSFDDMVQRNPASVITVVERALKGREGLRQTIRGTI